MGRRVADRVAAARAAAQRQAHEDAAAQRISEQRQRIDNHVAESAKLIPQALAALAARDHEGVVLVKVYAKRLPPLRWFVGSTKTVDIAGYSLTTSQVGETSRHGAETRQIYLLSDGRLMFANDAVGSVSQVGFAYSIEEYGDLARKAAGIDRDPGSRKKSSQQYLWNTPPSYYPIGILGQVESALRSICSGPTPT
jgi:hypothetical protein